MPDIPDNKLGKAVVRTVHHFKDYAVILVWMCPFLMAVNCISCLLLPRIFSVYFVIWQTILFAFYWMLFMLYYPLIENKYTRNRHVNSVVFALFMFISTLAGNSLVWLLSNAGLDLGIVSYIGFLIAFCVSFSLFTGKKGAKRKAALSRIEPIEKVLGIKELNNGDVVVCLSLEDIKKGLKDARVILPFHDRFVHMLIIGPTGCGKTSQMLIPMVFQDLKNSEYGVISIDPKGDYSRTVKFLSEHVGRKCIYFDPTMDDCPKFNPMAGKEVDVVDNLASIFRMAMPDSGTYFLDMGDQLVKNAIKVLKRLDKSQGIEGKNANLIMLSRLLQNTSGQGKKLIMDFQHVSAPTDEEASENNEIISWFLNEYFTERSKVFENTSGIRSIVAKLTSNEYLRDVLNPDVTKGEKNEINFPKILEEGLVVAISTAQGPLSPTLSRFLGFFLILQLQSAIFNRPGTEETRRPCFLYIDEFQTYANPGFSNMLTQGRSYRVGCILATQARNQVKMGGGRDGSGFLEVVQTNARNQVTFPDISVEDSEYFEKKFGTHIEEIENITESRKKPSIFSGFNYSDPSESIRIDEKEMADFTRNDLTYKDYGTITYSLVQDKTRQKAGNGLVTYIDKDISDEIKAKMAEYERLHLRKSIEEIADEQKANIESDIVWEDDPESTSSVPLPSSTDIFRSFL